MRRSHIWQGVILGGPLDGRLLTLNERDGAPLWILSHWVAGQRGTMKTLMIRGDIGLEEFLRQQRARVVWRRLWRSPLAA